MRALPLVVALLAGCAGASAPDASGAEGGWTRLADLPGERTEAAAVAAGGKLWVIGGIFPESPLATRVDVHDPSTGTWSEGPALPHAVHHAGVVALGDRIVVTGGFVGSPAFMPTAESWVLDASAADPAWETFVPLPEPRGAHGAATDGETIWIFGGVNAPLPAVYPPGLDLVALSRTAWALAPGAATWTPIAPLPDPRDHFAAVFLDGKAYAIGGRDLTLNRNTARVDAYDPAADDWSRARDMPSARGGLGAAVLSGRIHAVGGEAIGAAFTTHEAYDPVANAWTREMALPEPRHGVGVASLGGTLHVAAGGPEPAFTYSATLFAFRP